MEAIGTDGNPLYLKREADSDPLTGLGSVTFICQSNGDLGALAKAFPVRLPEGWKLDYQWDGMRLTVRPIRVEPAPVSDPEAPPAVLPELLYADRSENDLRTLLVEKGRPPKKGASRAELLAALAATL